MLTAQELKLFLLHNILNYIQLSENTIIKPNCKVSEKFPKFHPEKMERKALSKHCVLPLSSGKLFLANLSKIQSLHGLKRQNIVFPYSFLSSCY